NDPSYCIFLPDRVETPRTCEPKETLTDEQVTAALRSLRGNGTRPGFFSHPVRCKVCGPVWERDWTADTVESCAWCFRTFKGEIPRPTTADFREWAKKANPVDHSELVAERAAIREYSGGQLRDLAEKEAVQEIGPCFVCHGRKFWVSQSTIVCLRCHPPGDPRKVVRYIDLDESAVSSEQATPLRKD
ncbi:MAG: hypothetical protein HQM09_12385, partial [Candidatus Riflebacteria bacterium]|nr:hypothetical protein [Candidatus Riflebacteria bacterium]